MVAGIDVGNGYTKAAVQVEGESQKRLYDVQSAVALTSSDRINVDPSDETVGALPNTLDATVVGPGVKARDEHRMFFGARGVESDRPTERFDISSADPKSEESLSALMIADVLSSAALQAVWDRDGVMPEEVRVEASVATALPIGDYIEHADAFAERMKSGPMLVTVHNFGAPVLVRIVFEEVRVGAEGVVGTFALYGLGEKFFSQALAEARAEGQSIDKEVTGAMLAGVRSFVTVDIGDGTTNIAVFADGDLDVAASGSIPEGYGTVLERVVESSRNSRGGVRDRKELSGFLLQTNLMPAQRRVQERLQSQVDEECSLFAREVQREFSRVWSNVHLRSGVVYVYGGGATPMKPHLRELLVETVQMDGQDSVPIVILDSSYSRSLNRNGLFLMAENSSEKHH